MIRAVIDKAAFEQLVAGKPTVLLSWEANPSIAEGVRKHIDELPEDYSDYCVERDNERRAARDSERERRENSP